MGTDAFANAILAPEKAHKVRRIFAQTFLDPTSEHYKKYLKPFDDPRNEEQAYWGYMWDCLNSRAYNIVYGNPGEIFWRYKQCVYGGHQSFALWNVHDKRFDRAVEKLHPIFQTNGALAITLELYKEKVEIYPEDLYFFDNSFTWAAIFTHEENEKGERYCLWLSKV